MSAIVEAAARVLSKEGYAAASTNKIAEAAGVSIGTVYEYFADRDEVFDALIRRELEALVSLFASRQTDAGGQLLPRLAEMISAGMNSMHHGPALFRALERVPGATFRVHLEEARSQVIALVRRMLEEHRGELRVDDLDVAAFVAVTAVEGIAAAASNDRFDPGLAREMEDLLEGYLIGSAPTSPPQETS